MSWIYLPELVEQATLENSSGTGEPSAMSRLIPTASELSSNEYEMACLMMLRSGTISEPSVGSLGLAKWILSLPAFHVSHFRLLENARVKQTSGTCGPKPSESLAKYDRDMRSWKMYQGLLPLDISVESSVTFPKSGMTADGLLYPLKMLERHISEKGSGCWPTPEAHSQTGYQTNRYGRKAPRLGDAVKGVKPSYGGTSTRRTYPTPIKRDSRTFKGAQRMPNALGTEPLVVQIGGDLNPSWVEWLMGYPIGATDLKPLEMLGFRLWLQLHGIS